MDNLVFERENLARSLEELAGKLRGAAASYDPANPVPVRDLACALGASTLRHSVNNYLKALMSHGAGVAGDDSVRAMFEEHLARLEALDEKNN